MAVCCRTALRLAGFAAVNLPRSSPRRGGSQIELSLLASRSTKFKPEQDAHRPAYQL